MKESEWEEPTVEEVAVEEDSTTGACQGKKIGCYAGSSCGSVTKKPEKTGQKEEEDKKKAK